MKTIEEILDDKIKLPTFPAIALRIIEAVKTDDASMSELTKIVSFGSSACSPGVENFKFLLLCPAPESRLHPESLDNFRHGNPEKHCPFLCHRQLDEDQQRRKLQLRILLEKSRYRCCCRQILFPPPSNRSLTIFSLRPCSRTSASSFFYLCMPEEYLKVFDEKRVTALPVVKVEKKLFGYDHQEMGTRILEKWGLPEVYLPAHRISPHP